MNFAHIGHLGLILSLNNLPLILSMLKCHQSTNLRCHKEYFSALAILNMEVLCIDLLKLMVLVDNQYVKYVLFV